MDEKYCKGCDRYRFVTSFAKSSSSKDGLQYRCRDCMRLLNKKRRQKIKKAKYMKAYNAAYNKDSYLIKEAATQRFRCLKYGAKYVEDVDRKVVWGRDEGHCRINLVCNSDFVPFEQMHLDHIIPYNKGGNHSYANVQTSCVPCNLSKGQDILVGGTLV